MSKADFGETGEDEKKTVVLFTGVGVRSKKEPRGESGERGVTRL